MRASPQALSAKVAALDGGLAASRAEVRSLNEQLEQALAAALAAREETAAVQQQAELLQERARHQQQRLSLVGGVGGWRRQRVRRGRGGRRAFTPWAWGQTPTARNG